MSGFMARDDGVEDHHREEDGEDLLVGDGEGEHAPRGALLDPVLQDGAVLAHGAHAAPPAATAAAHPVSTHGHACNLQSGRLASAAEPARRVSGHPALTAEGSAVQPGRAGSLRRE